MKKFEISTHKILGDMSWRRLPLQTDANGRTNENKGGNTYVQLNPFLSLQLQRKEN